MVKEVKPFAGVIRAWRKNGMCIEGEIVWHMLHDKTTTEFAPGHKIRTSVVKRTSAHLDTDHRYTPSSDTDFVFCETQNSFYVLLGKERLARDHYVS